MVEEAAPLTEVLDALSMSLSSPAASLFPPYPPRRGRVKKPTASALPSRWKWRPRTAMCLFSCHVLLPLDLKDKESWASMEDVGGNVKRARNSMELKGCVRVNDAHLENVTV